METLKVKIPKKDSLHFGPQVIIKFHDFIDFNGSENVTETIEKSGVGNWKQLDQQFPGIKLQKIVTSLADKKLDALVNRASEMDPSYKPVNFKNYYVINCPAHVNAEELV